MPTMARPARHHSSATPLALAYAALVVYASLYPLSDWRWPPGQTLADLAKLPWPPWRDPADLWLNGLGYLPLGLLASVAARRSGLGHLAALGLGLLAPSALSYLCEVLQQFVPTRHPSLKDWAMNSVGATLGLLLATGFHRLGLADRWHALRGRWFVPDSAGAIALLALWPFGLLVPAPVPLGLGQLHEMLRLWLLEALEGVSWAAAVHSELLAAAPQSAVPSPLGDASITALGLLAPCLVAFSVVVPGWRRAVLALGALAIAFAVSTLSTLLNFGPAQALSWIGGLTPAALLAGTIGAMLLAPWSRGVILGCALIVLTGLVVRVAQAPADPYFAQTLQAWEQGRFVRFHGLAQWVGWLWPYAALGWLLAQLARPSQSR
jgi:VanZ family protein